MPQQEQIDAVQELWRRYQVNPAIFNETQVAGLTELRKRWGLTEKIEVTPPQPVSRPQFEPAVAATTAQQITIPKPPEPVEPPKPRPVPAITAPAETPKIEYRKYPHPIAGARGQVTLPTSESLLEVVNHWMRKNITGEMVSFETMEKTTGIPKGVLTNVWRSFKRAAPAGLPFLLEAAEGIRKAPAETLKQFAMYPLEWGNRLQIMASPYTSPYDKRKAAEEWAEDPLGPVFAFGISKGGVKAVGAVARKIPAKGRISPAEAVKPEIRPEVPVKPAEAPMPPLPETPALAEFRAFTGVPDPKMLVNAVRDISKLTSEMIEGVKMPPKIRKGFEAGRDVMIEHDRMIRQSEATSNYLEMVIDKNVPKNRQLDMVHAYEHKMKGPYWERLNELEQSLTKWLAGEKRKLNDFIDKNKVLERMEEKEVNHIFHHWLNPETGEPYQAMYGKLSKGLPQAKQRSIPDYATGVEQGMTPATANLGKLIGLEWQSATRSHQSRQMFASLQSIEAGVEGGIILRRGTKPKPLRMIERWDLLRDQGLTEGYERYQSPYLDKPIAYKDAKGKAVIIRPGAIGIREELYSHVRAYLENPNYNKFDQVNTAAKSLKLASFFHATQLGFQELANFRIPFKNIPRGLRKAGEWDDPVIRLLYQEGLEMRKGYEDLGYRNTFFEPRGGLGKAANQITKPIQFMRDFIFDIVQPGMKTSFAYDTYLKYRPRYEEWGRKRKMTEKQIDQFTARKAVEAADGHFSGEHYKRSLLETNRFMAKLYFSPEARVWWQRLLLSPTWQREHLLVFKNVVKSFMPDSMIKKLGMGEIGPMKSAFREYALGGATIIGSADLWNQMSTYAMDGESKHLWENPPGKGFAVRAWWDEPDYTVTDKNGKQRTVKGGPAYFRPLKSVFEVAEFADDPIRKFGYKLSPFITAVGRQFWPSVYQKQYEGWGDMDRRLWDFITDVGSPIAAERGAEVVKGKKKPIAAVLPFFGFPTSKVRNVSKRKALNEINTFIHEGDIERAYGLIRSWNRKNPGDIIVPESAYYGEK